MQPAMVVRAADLVTTLCCASEGMRQEAVRVGAGSCLAALLAQPGGCGAEDEARLGFRGSGVSFRLRV